ncbi:MAG: hypothetical protein H6834_09860 [Planctomycetes bacterium]|nr:hypothetical protein [Planctomycetota bacterium]
MPDRYVEQFGQLFDIDDNHDLGQPFELVLNAPDAANRKLTSGFTVRRVAPGVSGWEREDSAATPSDIESQLAPSFVDAGSVLWQWNC